MLTTVSELVSHSIAAQQPPDGLYPLLPWESLQHLVAHLEVQLAAAGVAIGGNTPVLPPPQSFIWPLVALFQLLSCGTSLVASAMNTHDMWLFSRYESLRSKVPSLSWHLKLRVNASVSCLTWPWQILSKHLMTHVEWFSH